MTRNKQLTAFADEIKSERKEGESLLAVYTDRECFTAAVVGKLSEITNLLTNLLVDTKELRPVFMDAMNKAQFIAAREKKGS